MIVEQWIKLRSQILKKKAMNNILIASRLKWYKRNKTENAFGKNP